MPDQPTLKLPETAAPKRYAFLLLPGFSQLGFTCALETLSLANRHQDQTEYYKWRLLSETGAPVAAWNGVVIQVNDALVPLEKDETLIVCAGVQVAKVSTKPVLNWLRRETRKGMDFGALSSGTYTLALAGLIGGKRVTTHWEYKSALGEMLPDVIMEDSIFSVDGRVFTTAGGAASMDMMLHRVSQDFGIDLARWVADQMVYTAPRGHSHAQRMSLKVGGEHRHSKLSLALQIMQNNIEDPLTPDEIAEVVRLSTRQLERLFARHLTVSPKRYYLRLRLERARELLRQTQMSITEISVVCGFRSPSHFSKSYRKEFATNPSQDATEPGLLWPGTT
jgi:transcriptional regulator GlxA family with amidase domain